MLLGDGFPGVPPNRHRFAACDSLESSHVGGIPPGERVRPFTDDAIFPYGCHQDEEHGLVSDRNAGFGADEGCCAALTMLFEPRVLMSRCALREKGMSGICVDTRFSNVRTHEMVSPRQYV